MLQRQWVLCTTSRSFLVGEKGRKPKIEGAAELPT